VTGKKKQDLELPWPWLGSGSGTAAAPTLGGRGGKDLHGAARVGEDSARWGGLRAQGGLLLGVATALGTRIATRSAAACDGSARGRRRSVFAP